MNIKKGNAFDFIFKIIDTEDNLVTDLATAIAIKFMVKKAISDNDLAALINKNLGDGITVDLPTIGYITVNLDSNDTNINAGAYYFALQIEYAVDEKIEVNLKEGDCVINSLNVIQDIIE